MALESKLLLLFAFFLAFSYTSSVALKAKVTKIQFYMHDIVSEPNPTAVRVTSPANYTGPNPSFGTIVVMDNPLTVTPDLNSTLLGRAQGIYVIASQSELSFLMSLTIGFISGPYNGSTFSVLARNPIMNEVREMPIVGGTGIFRLARGYCLARTYSAVNMDAVVGYNVTLIHY